MTQHTNLLGVRIVSYLLRYKVQKIHLLNRTCKFVQKLDKIIIQQMVK